MSRVNESIFDRARANVDLTFQRIRREIEEAGGIENYRALLRQRAAQTPQPTRNIFQAASEGVEQIPASDS